MQITIIQFSPSGNTLKITQMLIKALEARNQHVQLIDITGDPDFFAKCDLAGFLRQKVRRHDVLLVGGPVYAHHMQYHVLDLIEALPAPDTLWGRYAMPYVTYGGISSGVALKETAKLLKRSGRIVCAGMKVSTPHSMTRAFMEQEFNGDRRTEENAREITELVDKIVRLEMGGKAKNNAGHLNYNGLATTIKAKIIFKEKMWHAQRYPQISIDRNACANCGKCAGRCPTLHLEIKDGMLLANDTRSCIHCFNCVSGCPVKAIGLVGDLAKGRAFMQKMIAKCAGKEIPATMVYPAGKTIDGNNC